MASETTERELPDVVPGRVHGAVELVVRWFPLVIVAGLWELASGRVVSSAVLPPPSIVFGTVAELLVTGEILPHLLISVWRVAAGLGASIVVGVVLGIGMARSRSVENFFDVFLALLYPVPKTGLVPLAILWLGRGTETAILIIFLACLLPIILNSYNAATNVDRNLIWSAQMMGTSERQLLRKVVIPDTIPEIVTGIRQAIPVAFIALIGAELIGASEGMGAVILTAGQLGNYPRMFAVIVYVSAASFLTLRGFGRLERRVFVWT